MKKIVMLSIVLLCIALFGCDNSLVTHRTVEKMNETTNEDYYQSSFISLNGRTVIKIKKDNNDGTFKCVASLSSGSISVIYFDFTKSETTLFTLNKDESIDESYGYVTSNDKGYLVIDAVEGSSGSIYISWN